MDGAGKRRLATSGKPVGFAQLLYAHERMKVFIVVHTE